MFGQRGACLALLFILGCDAPPSEGGSSGASPPAPTGTTVAASKAAPSAARTIAGSPPSPPSPTWRRDCSPARGMASFCLHGRTDGPDQVFTAGGSVHVSGAIHVGCIPSSHNKVDEGTCTLDRDGGQLILEEELCLLRSNAEGPQTADCLGGGTPVPCRTESVRLERGSYTLQAGAKKLTFRVPSRVPSEELCLPKRESVRKREKVPQPFVPSDL